MNYPKEFYKSKTYRAWSNMRTRCYNQNYASFDSYGGRGISVCNEWQCFSEFLSDMGEAPKSMSLDRIDVNKNYTKENCRWATMKTQQNNRTNNRLIEYNGIIRTIAEWADSLSVDQRVFGNRLRRGWSVTEAIEKPFSISNWSRRNM